MDHPKCGYASLDKFVKAHKQCDQADITTFNRQFVTLLHDAVFPSGSRLTKATAKLQSLLDGPVIKLVLEDTALGVAND